MTEPCRALRGLLEAVVREYRRILGRNLAGIYLHGSAAFGCFRWQTSDIDLLVAVHAPPSSRQKEGLVRTLLAQGTAAPPAGFEMSVVLVRYCRQFVWPVPYELHFSNMHRASFEKDLSAAWGGKAHASCSAPSRLAHIKPPFCTTQPPPCRMPGQNLYRWC